MKRLMLCLSLLLVPSLASAQAALVASESPVVTLLSAAPLNGAAATLTVTRTAVQKKGFTRWVLNVLRTRVAGTDLTMTCTNSFDANVNKASLTTCTYDATGVCTSVAAVMKSTTSASEKLVWEVNLGGYGRLDCVFASTAAGAGDLLTVQGVMVTP